MPIRKIPKNYRNITGIAPCNKAVGIAAYESSLERDFFNSAGILILMYSISKYSLSRLSGLTQQERSISIPLMFWFIIKMM